MEQKERAEAVLLWRESLITLNDAHFFELLRMYLGEIKTPFNKQKLIEELSSFLRKEENVQMIVRLLSPNDVLILSAIKILKIPTQEKLSQLFSTDFSFAELYERLMNLEERLLIYRKTEQKQVCFAINPLLARKLEPLLSVSVLLPKGSCFVSKTCQYELSTTFFASLFSFFFHYKNLCKNDSSFKKKGESLVLSTFHFAETPSGKDFFYLVFDGLKNLQLLVHDEAELRPNMERWKQFAYLDDISRCCYLCAASCARLTNDMLQKYAQLIFSICSTVPDGGFSYPVLMRSALLQNEKMTEEAPLKKNRFALLLQDVKQSLNNSESNANPTERSNDKTFVFNVELSTIVQQILKMGLLVESDGMFIKSECFNKMLHEHNSGIVSNCHNVIKGSLSLNPDFTAMLLHEVCLAELLPLMQILCIRRFDTVPVFEISRESCTNAFDSGITVVKIKNILKNAISYELSQSLEFSLEDWENSYNSAILYKGYVLKVDKEKRAIIENSKIIAPYLIEILAEGVYLFDFVDDEEAGELLKKSGLKYIGAVKTAKQEHRSLPFMPLKEVSFQNVNEMIVDVLSKKERDNLLNSFYIELENRRFPEEQADGLRSRIRRKIVVNPVQLRGNSVRFERIEAGGMDFLGKVHIIDHAVSTNSMIEISFDEESERLVGVPLSVEKHEGDTILKLCVEPEKTIKIISVSKIAFIKRIRGAIFKEL